MNRLISEKNETSTNLEQKTVTPTLWLTVSIDKQNTMIVGTYFKRNAEFYEYQ